MKKRRNVVACIIGGYITKRSAKKLWKGAGADTQTRICYESCGNVCTKTKKQADAAY
jgi:hypothetical protein